MPTLWIRQLNCLIAAFEIRALEEESPAEISKSETGD
jgi:hypothetical protein